MYQFSVSGANIRNLLHITNYAEQKIFRTLFLAESETDENQHCITEYKTHDTNDDTNLHHILLLNEAC